MEPASTSVAAAESNFSLNRLPPSDSAAVPANAFTAGDADPNAFGFSCPNATGDGRDATEIRPDVPKANDDAADVADFGARWDRPTERVTDVVFPEEVKRRQRRARKQGLTWTEPVQRPGRDERSVPDPSRGATRGRAPRVLVA